ncbi:alpha/beta fold hydrolase [Flavobacterium franklandianum]|uniref:Alpha/beta hydrolase n=1 Tax=Flavobacterium franklandianum TaxID=2594430 RepID=A0A553C7R0_9FLAO|nr:alpha/beta hydrolase [Flavobacterium franklandianum]TRX16548.1 alpha/beta hydrolase [Flavobacterium franklandianum]
MPKKTPNHKQSLKIPKLILLFSKIIASISPKLSILLSAKLFTTPIKHRTPKRELEMEKKSIQKLIEIPVINKKVMTYEYGKSDKKILLSHGWSGRGTQLFKIAEELLKVGYSTVSFDAPAHGKSAGKTTIMTEFIETILEVEKKYGPFEAAVGHSLGGMSLINATKKGLVINRLVIIGSGDVVQDILDDFVAKLQLQPSTSLQLRLYFEKKYDVKMDDFSAYKSAIEIAIPVLVIHDIIDIEVPISAAFHIHKHLKNGELFVTEGLGHRKILGNSEVIDKVINFLQNKN